MTDNLSVPETLARQQATTTIATDASGDGRKGTRPRFPADLRLGIMTWEWDASISETQMQSISDADLREELGLSREDLGRIFARAKEIVQGLCPNDEVLITYDADCGNWYIDFSRPDSNGQWKVSVYRNEHFDHRFC